MKCSEGNLSSKLANDNGFRTPARLSVGTKILIAFFLFGALACTLTIAALLLPGSLLELLWRFNPEARAGFAEMGRPVSILIMLTVGSACGAAAMGLARGRNWGRKLAMAILGVNLAGDLISAFVRHDPRTLIGLPIGGGMLFYLWRKQEKNPRPPAKGGT